MTHPKHQRQCGHEVGAFGRGEPFLETKPLNFGQDVEGLVPWLRGNRRRDSIRGWLKKPVTLGEGGLGDLRA